MKTTYKKLTVPTDRPVEKSIEVILRSVDSVARSLNIGYFVGGAAARDLILTHVFGQNIARLTHDIDLGVCLRDWALFDVMKNALVEEGNFTVTSPHRLNHKPTNTPLDLIPFGAVERSDSTIAWPPNMDIIMTVAGFAEAYTAAIEVEIVPSLLIPVASLPSLAILKVIAWNDRRVDTQKDATDFFLLLCSYHNAHNIDRLYDQEPELLEATGYDLGVAGAMLLGKDAAHVCTEATAKFVLSLYTDEYKRQQLIEHMTPPAYVLGNNGATYAQAEVYAASFFQTFRQHVEIQ